MDDALRPLQVADLTQQLVEAKQQVATLTARVAAPPVRTPSHVLQQGAAASPAGQPPSTLHLYAASQQQQQQQQHARCKRAQSMPAAAPAPAPQAPLAPQQPIAVPPVPAWAPLVQPHQAAPAAAAAPQTQRSPRLKDLQALCDDLDKYVKQVCSNESLQR